MGIPLVGTKVGKVAVGAALAGGFIAWWNKYGRKQLPKYVPDPGGAIPPTNLAVSVVRDADGSPVAGVVLTAIQPLGKMLATATTDKQGAATLAAVSWEEHSLQVDASAAGAGSGWAVGPTTYVVLGPESEVHSWGVSDYPMTIHIPGQGPLG